MESGPLRDVEPGELVGRQEELKAVEGVLAAVRDGMSGVLVLVGEPGVGKTRLLEHAEADAVDVLVARVVGMEAEARLGFAALHRLLLPFLGRIDGLPGPQREALRSAFGLEAGPPADRFRVGLAVLTLLSQVAGEQPLVCLVDDTQWMDRESVETLAFVGRRLQADGIGLLFAVREGGGKELDGLPTVHLKGLRDLDARRLLAAKRLDAETVARAVAETGGNPLALIELAELLSGRHLPPTPLPVGPRMEAHFLAQVRALPPQTQRLLLLLALAPPDDPPVVWQAARMLGLPPASADVAVSAGILSRQRDLTFRHPLIRSAVHGGAAPAERRSIHQTLATVLDPDRDPVRRAWHLAEATVGVDEQVAAELERVAERTRGYSAQAMFLSRAAELTPDPEARYGRLLTAAEAYIVAGDHASAQATLDRVTSGLADPVVRARAQRLRARIDMFFYRVTHVPAVLLRAVAGADERLVRVMLLEALQAALLGRRAITGTTLEEVARAVLDTPRTGTSPDPLLEALAVRVVHGYAAAQPVLREAINTILATDDLKETGAPIAIMATVAAEEIWDERARRALLDHIDKLDRDQGALYALRATLLNLATSELWAGDFAAAEACHASMDEVLDVLGVPRPGPVHKVELIAWQGREAEARAAAELADRYVRETGLGVLTNRVLHALTVLELSLGHYSEARALAVKVYDDDPPCYGNLILPLLVEAGVRSGDRAVAQRAIARLAERAAISGTPWALGLLARSRALLIDDDSAEAFYREAIERLEHTLIRTETARAHLLYGEWLRRRLRRSAARTQLRTAHDMFAAMGAAGFAERAREELLATGERARKRVARTEHELTSRERRVAGMAAAGRTNAEIAAMLYITTSTVEYHLNKVFRKLNITSRRQLAAALRSELPQA